MVFAFSPDSRATLIKLNPRPGPGFAGSSAVLKNARDLRGRARARTLSRDSTTANLLKDWRNVRREEDKRAVPSRSWLVLEFAPTLLSASLLCKLTHGCKFKTSSFMRVLESGLTHETPEFLSAAQNYASLDSARPVHGVGPSGKC